MSPDGMGLDGISPDRSISRSPSGDNKCTLGKSQETLVLVFEQLLCFRAFRNCHDKIYVSLYVSKNVTNDIGLEISEVFDAVSIHFL